MVLNFYGLREQPFGVTPDPRYLYLSPTHREALASLLYGIEVGRGFMALVAKPGMGKTTLLSEILSRQRDSARTVFLFQTQCDSREFLRYVVADLGFDVRGQDPQALHEILYGVFLNEMRAGRRFLLVVDEAQNLDEPVLETIRLLSDFETPRAKLLQIILVGQPNLAQTLARPSLAQLRQRISVLSRLDPLVPVEVNSYIDHRLRVAGYARGPLFTREAKSIIAACSRGIPRDINNLCFHALSLGYALGNKTIDSEIIHEAVRDSDLDALIENEPTSPTATLPPRITSPGEHASKKGDARLHLLPGAVLASLLLLGGWLSLSPRPGSPPAGVSAIGRTATTLSDFDNSTKTPRSGRGKAAAQPALGAIQPKAAMPASTPALTIVVGPQQTLSELSVSYLGRFDPESLGRIRELNPQLSDPNRIFVGQHIRLPQSAKEAKEAPAAGETELSHTVLLEKP